MVVIAITWKSDSPVSTTQVLRQLRGTFIRIRFIHVGFVGNVCMAGIQTFSLLLLFDQTSSHFKPILHFTSILKQDDLSALNLCDWISEQ